MWFFRIFIGIIEISNILFNDPCPIYKCTGLFRHWAAYPVGHPISVDLFKQPADLNGLVSIEPVQREPASNHPAVPVVARHLPAVA